LETEKKEILLERQAQDLDLEKRTLQNDEQAFVLKKEKDKQNQQNLAAPSRRATMRTSVRGRSRGARAGNGGAAGRSKAQLAPKPKPKADVRLSSNSIKIEDDNDECRSSMGK
jgi:hypothetical protein